MVERKLYKTKLCVLYRRGRCNRQTCSFAHGEAELRRFSGSFNGRRDYRGNDLRDKLDRRRSPLRAGKDSGGQRGSRGYSPSETPGKRSGRRSNIKQRLEGDSDFSGSLKISDGTEDQNGAKKFTSSNSQDVLYEQLKQVQSEIRMLNDKKRQLEIYLEESAQEADSLNSRIQELEMQLFKEREECKSITSKVKKFVKAHQRHMRIQDELKRSQARLQKLGDHLGSDATRTDADDEDLNINILSDCETPANHLTPRNELQRNSSPSKKRPRIHLEAEEDPKQGPLNKGAQRVNKASRWNDSHVQFNNTEEYEVDTNGRLGNENKPSRGKKAPTNISSANKPKASEAGLLPSTSMAAHALDEIVEVVEMEDKFEGVETTALVQVEKAAAYETALPFRPPPPPPPVPRNAYAQYEGGNQNVDIEQLHEEMLDVDIV